jgi:predicted nucleic acid-binding protein
VIVADASVIADLVLWRGDAAALADLLLGEEPVVAPALVDLEVAQVLRRWNRSGELADERARQAVLDLLDLPVARQPHDLLLDRVWTLRHDLTAYDAAYLALAELVDARLVTFDRGLAEVAARTVEILVPPGAPLVP